MAVRTRIASKFASLSWAPRLLPQIVAVDKRFQRLTRGKVGLVDLAGLPSLTLTVPGRKSGVPRSTPLLCTPYDGGWLIAGSAFGDPKPPAWVANLRAADTATVRFKGEEQTATWTELEGEERQRAWAEMTRLWPNYDRYAERAGRVIPVFHLRPAGPVA